MTAQDLTLTPVQNAAPVTPVYFNRKVSNDELRERVFGGSIFIHSALPGVDGLMKWSKELIDEAFNGAPDVRDAHRHFSKDEFVARAGPLKSRFTNDAKTKQLCQELVAAIGADPERTFFDLPRLRVIPPANYLTAGVSYNYAPHRDTWYAHPRQLVNFWAPVYDTESTTVMSMFVDQFRRAVENNSEQWDYDDWVKNSRFKAADNVVKEERAHPLPVLDVAKTTQLRLVLNGGDMMIFSTCQLHASTPNQTDRIRFSFDLRTLNVDDFLNERGPKDPDGHAGGTTLGDFLRGTDLKPLNIADYR